MLALEFSQKRGSRIFAVQRVRASAPGRCDQTPRSVRIAGSSINECRRLRFGRGTGILGLVMEHQNQPGLPSARRTKGTVGDSEANTIAIEIGNRAYSTQASALASLRPQVRSSSPTTMSWFIWCNPTPRANPGCDTRRLAARYFGEPSCRTLCSYLLMTLQVIGSIHWHIVHFWQRGVTFYRPCDYGAHAG